MILNYTLWSVRQFINSIELVRTQKNQLLVDDFVQQFKDSPQAAILNCHHLLQTDETQLSHSDHFSSLYITKKNTVIASIRYRYYKASHLTHDLCAQYGLSDFMSHQLSMVELDNLVIRPGEPRMAITAALIYKTFCFLADKGVTVDLVAGLCQPHCAAWFKALGFKRYSLFKHQYGRGGLHLKMVSSPHYFDGSALPTFQQFRVNKLIKRLSRPLQQREQLALQTYFSVLPKVNETHYFKPIDFIHLKEKVTDAVQAAMIAQLSYDEIAKHIIAYLEVAAGETLCQMEEGSFELILVVSGSLELLSADKGHTLFQAGDLIVNQSLIHDGHTIDSFINSPQGARILLLDSLLNMNQR